MKVKAVSVGMPPLSGAAAFAQLLAAAMAKKPELKVVDPAPWPHWLTHNERSSAASAGSQS